MADVRAREVLAGWAVAVNVERKLVELVFCVVQVADSVKGERLTVPRVAAGHYAVEQVNSSRDRFKNIRRGSHAHKVADFVLRRVGLDLFDNLVHNLGRLAHGKSADCVAVKVKLCNLLHMINAQILVCTALINAEKHLLPVDCTLERVKVAHTLLAPFQPARCAVYAVLCISVGGGVLNTFVKRHSDCRAEVRLNVHTLLGPHKDFSAVDVGVKVNAFLLDVPKLCEGEYLKSAAVGEDWTVPARKLVKSAEGFNVAVARSEVQVIGVAKLNLALYIFEVKGRHRAFNRTAGRDVHKRRSLKSAVRRDKLTPASVPFCLNKLKHISSKEL